MVLSQIRDLCRLEAGVSALGSFLSFVVFLGFFKLCRGGFILLRSKIINFTYMSFILIFIIQYLLTYFFENHKWDSQK